MLEEDEIFNNNLEGLFGSLQTLVSIAIKNPEAKIFSDNLLFLYLMQDKLKEVINHLALKVYYEKEQHD